MDGLGRWARLSEKAWHRFFEVDSKWYNSYLFYAQALALQGKDREMEMALKTAAKICGRPTNWGEIKKMRQEIENILIAMAANSK